jgi:hypothetical protein
LGPDNTVLISAHHGIYFRQPPKTENNKSPKPLPSQVPAKDVEPEPLICLGYVFEDSLVYMGDVSSIPDRSWKYLEGIRQKHQKGVKENGHSKPNGVARTALEESVNQSIADLNLDSGIHGHTERNGAVLGKVTTPNPLILVVDSLWPLRSHPSHFSFPQALATALRLGADLSLLIGFVHPTTHFIWEELCLSIREEDGKRDHPDSEAAKALVKKVWNDKQFSGDAGKKLKEWAGRVEPSWDGLKLEITPDGWTEVASRGISL